MIGDILNSTITQTILTILVVPIIVFLFKSYKDKKIEHNIYNFIKYSNVNNNYKYRTTHAISSDLNISEDKIKKVCSKSKKIIRNQKEKESWRIKQ